MKSYNKLITQHTQDVNDLQKKLNKQRTDMKNLKTQHAVDVNNMKAKHSKDISLLTKKHAEDMKNINEIIELMQDKKGVTDEIQKLKQKQSDLEKRQNELETNMPRTK